MTAYEGDNHDDRKGRQARGPYRHSGGTRASQCHAFLANRPQTLL